MIRKHGTEQQQRLTTPCMLALLGTVLNLATLCSAAEQAPVQIAFVQIPVSPSEPAGPEIGRTILAHTHVLGARVVTAEWPEIASTIQGVSEAFVCAADPVFSHDGTQLAFAGKKSLEDFLQVWELPTGTTTPVQATNNEADCISPIYMPSGHFVFASLLSWEYEEHGAKYAFSLYEQAPGAQKPTRLTFNPSSDFSPAVLADGRILYTSTQHVGNHHWPHGNMALMLINSDGTGIFPLTGNHRGPWMKQNAVPYGADRIAFVASGPSAQFGAGALLATSLNDAFAPYSVLVDGNNYQVQSAAPLPDGRFVLSARPADASRPTFGLYALEEQTVTLLYDDPEFHDLSPALSVPSKRPELRISTVVPDTPHGYVLVLNCYETDRNGQHALQEGKIRSARVIQGLPLQRTAHSDPRFFSVEGREEEPLLSTSSAAGYIPARILGEVPLAADGSLYLKVPADRPLRLQLVDHEGFAVMNERAWFWLRPNERRVCIGCHENRELSAHNATPLAARKAPADLLQSAQWQEVSFRQDIQPILSANCAVTDCHMPPNPTAGLNLTADQRNGDRDAVLADRFGPAYANLLKRQKDKPFGVGGRLVHPGDSRGSPLLWMLYGRPLAKQYAPAPFERPMVKPHPGPKLPQEVLELICKWIDLGAQYDCNPESAPPPHAIHETGEMEEKHNAG